MFFLGDPVQFLSLLPDLHILLLMAPSSRSVQRQQIRKRKLKIPVFQSYCFLFHHPLCDQFVPASWERNTDASFCFDQSKVKHDNTNWIRQIGLNECHLLQIEKLDWDTALVLIVFLLSCQSGKSQQDWLFTSLLYFARPLSIWGCDSFQIVNKPVCMSLWLIANTWTHLLL